MHKKAKVNIEFDPILNETQENIVHLLLNYSPYVAPKFLLKRDDLTRELLNAIGKYIKINGIFQKKKLPYFSDNKNKVMFNLGYIPKYFWVK